MRPEVELDLCTPEGYRGSWQRMLGALNLAVFIGLFLVMIALFFVIPVIMTAILSLTGLDYTFRWNFVGLSNFLKLMRDSVVPQVIGNTLIYIFFTCLINVGFGLLLALLSTYFIKNENAGLLFRTLWLLPRMTPSTIYALLWLWFLDPTDRGMLNSFMRIFHIAPQNWVLNYPLPVIVLANGMIGASFGMVVFSSAIKAISDDYYKTAMIDGANNFQIIRLIIIPFLKWPIMFLTIWQTLSLLTSYEYVLLITNGGPLFDSEVMALFSYHKAFSNLEFGYGAAIAVILVIVGILLTILMLKLFGFNRIMNPSKLGD